MGKTRAQRLALNCTLDICEPGSDGGLILPMAGEAEQDWPNGLRIVLYLIGLLWFFMGVAIVSDVFMGAIEKITSKKRRVWNEQTQRHYTVQVWNDTVANLTLMALGSSAPEILLSLIELIGNKFYSGSLGPSTIVGSAAFNLLMISAVCVMAIPNGSARTIKDINVFGVTATFSIFAYVWLLLIVSAITPNVIDIWEGFITFLLFPLLVTIAYLADIGYFKKEPKAKLNDPEAGDSNPIQIMKPEDARVTIMDMTKDELASMEAEVRSKNNSFRLTDEQLATLIQCEIREPKTRAAYRAGATRKMVGGRRLSVGFAQTSQTLRPSQVAPEEVEPQEVTDERTEIFFEFGADRYAVMENIGTLEIPIEVSCTKPFTKPVSVWYETRDGSAKQHEDFEPVSGRLEFQPDETEKKVKVKIIDDSAYEADEMFFMDLSKATCSEPGFKAVLGDNNTCTIAIIDDDHPGLLCFESNTKEVTEEEKDTVIQIKVLRKGGANGEVSCQYYTEGDTAVEDKDFIPIKKTTLDFKHGQVSADIAVTIKSVGRYEVSEQFRLCICDPRGGARFDKKTDGGDNMSICTIIITPNESAQKRTDAIMDMLVGNWDKAQIGHANWKDQLKEAIMVNGGDDDEPPSAVDYVMHAITVFWKVLFALIPPVDFCDGWLCFVCSLGMIGVVTAFIGDLAGFLGCTMGIPNEITAITFVALGTSLPDTFASKTAAEQDPYADASIGNVTGSNSVNVFLGLGLPWMIGSIYWAATGINDKWKSTYRNTDVLKDYPDGGKFVVIGGDLGFSVSVFSSCAVVCIVIILVRRHYWQAELGGPVLVKYITAVTFVCLWFIYIGLSSWKVLDTRSNNICYN